MMATERKGILAVLSGPSGVGKSTIIQHLLQDERFALSTSATTRDPRPNEVDGHDYHFLSQEEFLRRIERGEFLEWAVVHGKNHYGTLFSEVDRLLAAGLMVILDVDVQGALALKDREDLVRVFIAPPTFDDLERRLRKRATETEETIETRLETARGELALMDQYDHVVVNDKLEQTVETLQRLLEAARKETE